MQKIKIPSKQIRLLLNYECNAKCPYCWKECQSDFSYSVKDYSLWESFLIQLFDSVEEIERISLSGGEPLLVPYIPEICALCSSYASRLTLSTNGSIPDRVEKVCKYVDEIHFSIDTLDRNKYKKIKGLDINVVLRSIIIAQKKNVKIRINTVTNDKLISINDIKALHEFCRENRITLSLIKPFLAESELLKEAINFFLTQDYELKKGKRRYILKSADDKVQIVYCICDWVKLFSKDKGKNCLENNSLFVNYKFEALPCLLKNDFIKLFDFQNNSLLIKNLRKSVMMTGCPANHDDRGRRPPPIGFYS